MKTVVVTGILAFLVSLIAADAALGSREAHLGNGSKRPADLCHRFQRGSKSTQQ